ncbi:hypothetical protein QAD02_002909 [Eretmocerus hayati]|uniref:Uncharacterized protein n=1 Tax=Eretmocerus hayati TaxID=131215 RepID=A0ACC2NK75_9HYME|nr:hypothetical protein QAD02_002909 [Eretmocerus hayati]
MDCDESSIQDAQVLKMSLPDFGPAPLMERMPCQCSGRTRYFPDNIMLYKSPFSIGRAAEKNDGVIKSIFVREVHCSFRRSDSNASWSVVNKSGMLTINFFNQIGHGQSYELAHGDIIKIGASKCFTYVFIEGDGELITATEKAMNMVIQVKGVPAAKISADMKNLEEKVERRIIQKRLCYLRKVDLQIKQSRLINELVQVTAAIRAESNREKTLCSADKQETQDFGRNFSKFKILSSGILDIFTGLLNVFTRECDRLSLEYGLNIETEKRKIREFISLWAE